MLEAPKYTGMTGLNNGHDNFVDLSQRFYRKLGEGSNMSIDSFNSLQMSNGGGSVAMSLDNSSVGSNESHTVGDSLFITELNSEEKDPIKSISFGNSNPVCHAFDSEAKDGHDLLIGLNSGDVYSGSLRLQLQDVGNSTWDPLLYKGHFWRGFNFFG